MYTHSVEAIREVAAWQSEAKDEDFIRYFYHYSDVGLLENGTKNYVIGRKGTGKTAIAEYIRTSRSANTASRILSFKNFPFNLLYEHTDASYTAPNQFISLWEYVINTTICHMMAENDEVNYDSKRDLAKIFNYDLEGALQQSVRLVTNREFGLSVLGFGGKPLPFNDVWRLFFMSMTYRGHHRRSDELFKVLLRSTFNRPRDIINYIKECAAIAGYEQSTLIGNDMLAEADRRQSEYMRREVVDEAYSVVEDISEIFDVLAEMRKPIFSLSEFKTKYTDYQKDQNGGGVLDATTIAKTLYHFNVFGNVTSGSHQIFAYNTVSKRLKSFREYLHTPRPFEGARHSVSLRPTEKPARSANDPVLTCNAKTCFVAATTRS